MLKIIGRFLGLVLPPVTTTKFIETELQREERLNVNWEVRQRAENEWFWERQAILEGKKHPSF